jgi:hypothetical protein
MEGYLVMSGLHQIASRLGVLSDATNDFARPMSASYPETCRANRLFLRDSHFPEEGAGRASFFTFRY